MSENQLKQEFMKFTEKISKRTPRLERKIGHSIRVMDCSIKIAESLNLSKEEIYVSAVIGLLHDIGKLKQIDDESYKSIEHGKLAVEILKKDNYIRKYIEDSKYDNIIFKAIENHGLFEIEEGLSEKELLFAKIIRDADKLDIFYEGAEMFWNSEKEQENIGNSQLSQNILEEFKQHIKIDRESRVTPLDGIVEFISMIYNIYFKYDFIILKQEDYINKILNKFEFIDVDTREHMQDVRVVANSYIQNKCES